MAMFDPPTGAALFISEIAINRAIVTRANWKNFEAKSATKIYMIRKFCMRSYAVFFESPRVVAQEQV